MRLPNLNPTRRRARAENAIAAYEFPASVRRAIANRYPGADWALVERGLREWFICLANARGRPLATPSRVVDDAWDAFVLDEPAYRDFCDRTYGRFIEHIPEDAMHAEGWKPLVRTVSAWDRSRASRGDDSVLWSLDEQLQIDRPFGIAHEALAQIRSNEDTRYGGPYMYGGGGGPAW